MDGTEKERGSKLINIFRTIHSVIFWFLVVLYSVVVNKGSYIITLFIKDEEKKKIFYQKSTKLWGILLSKASLVKVKVSGLENIPRDTNVIFTANHQSYLDIFILLKYLPDLFTFVTMRKLFKVPFIGDHIARAGFLSLDRKDRRGSIRTIHTIVDLAKKGRSFVIFPEGKLTKDGTIGEFGRGTSIIIQHSKKPVVPIKIDGNFDVLPKGSWKLQPGKVEVKIGKPLYFKDYQDDLTKKSSVELSSKLRNVVASLHG